MNMAGDRQHRINLFKPKLRDDGFGGQQTQYVLAEKRWAQIMPPSFRQQEAMGTAMSRETLTIRIQPQMSELKRGWRVEWKKDIYTVIAVDNTYRDRTLFVAQRYNPGE